MFSNTFSVSALAVYEEFDSAGALADMNLQQLTEFLIQKRKNRFLLGNLWRNPFRKLPEVLTVYPKAINDSVNQVLSISIISMKALEAQIKSFNNKVFYAQMELIPNTLTSVNGIGSVYSTDIIARIGDINRFPKQAALAKYADLVWSQHQSGNFDAQNTCIIKSRNRYLNTNCVKLLCLL
mgnify:FL=1